MSAGHLFKKYNKSISKKIYPLDSEHFSIYKFIENNKNLTLNNLTLTANTTIAANEGASCVGPLTVANNIILTVNGEMVVN